MQIQECPVCNSRQLLFFIKTNDSDFLQCKNCGVIFMDPLPTVERLTSDFLSAKSGWHLKLHRDLANIKKPRKDFIRIIDKLVVMGLTENLLDVGCANGELLFLAKEKGFKVQGVEINKDSAKIASDNGLDVFGGKLQEANFPGDYFSVICLMGVIEDIPDPAALLQECARILKKGGILVVSTLNMDCFWVAATKKLNTWFAFPWSVMIPYYRLFVFSDVNLKNLLARSTFTVKDITYSPVDFRHELGAVRLLLKSDKKSLGSFYYLLLVFLAYGFVYGIYFLLRPFLHKDFLMTLFVEKSKD